MSIKEFEDHLRRSGDHCPLRSLMTADYSQMAGGGVDGDSGEPTQQQDGWWPWIDSGGGPD